MDEVKKEVRLGDLFANHVFSKKTARQQLIDEAFEKCNASLVAFGKKPKPIRFYAIRVNSCCPEEIDCHYLLKRCQKGVFAKVFFGATKQK